MSFKDFIEEHFGTIKQFSELLGYNRVRGSHKVSNPSELTAAQILTISKKTGVDQCEIVNIINKSHE